MEQTPGSSNPNRFDVPPRDGPAVFIVNRNAFDRGELVGGWVALTSDSAAVAAVVDEM